MGTDFLVVFLRRHLSGCGLKLRTVLVDKGLMILLSFQGSILRCGREGFLCFVFLCFCMWVVLAIGLCSLQNRIRFNEDGRVYVGCGC